MKHPDFARRFKEACRDAKVPTTQDALGKFFGVSGVMVWNYYHGEKLPSMKTAIVIAQKLDICVEWLLTGRGPKHPGDMVDISNLPLKVQAAVQALISAFKESLG